MLHARCCSRQCVDVVVTKGPSPPHLYFLALHDCCLLVPSFAMLLSQIPCLFLAAAAIGPVAAKVDERAAGSLASWLASENYYALQGVLNNIGPNGSKVPGAKPGIVVASPSTSNPDCTEQLSDVLVLDVD